MREIVKLLSNQEIHLIRQKGSTEAFQFFAEICYPPLVGKQKWKVRHQHCALSSLVTEADEALAALILENNFDEWKMKAKGLGLDKEKRYTKYTHGGVDGKGIRKGWSLEGRERFNKLFDSIDKLRKSHACKTLETSLMEGWKKGMTGGKRKRGIDDDGSNAEVEQRALEIREETFRPRFCSF